MRGPPCRGFSPVDRILGPRERAGFIRKPFTKGISVLVLFFIVGLSASFASVGPGFFTFHGPKKVVDPDHAETV